MNASLLLLVLAIAGNASASDAPIGRCASVPRWTLAGPSWNGWSPDSSNSRFQAAAAAALDADKTKRLKLKWAFGFPKASEAWAQPTVVGGRVLTGSADGTVYALDAKSGCVHWTFKADAGVRGAVNIGEIDAGGRKRPAAFFGDVRGTVYAVDAATGERLWHRRVEAHPFAKLTGSLRLHGGRLYVPVSSTEEAAAQDLAYECCTFRGSVVALDARDGTQVWKSHAITEAPGPVRKNEKGTQLRGPSGAAIWSAPTVDPKRGRLYVATGNSYSDPAAATSDAILALELESGRIVWHRQVTSSDVFNLSCAMDEGRHCTKPVGEDLDFGASPILVEGASRSVLLAGQKSGVVTALDPDAGGAVVWQRRVGKGGRIGGIQWGMAADGAKVYAAVSDAAWSAGEDGEQALDPSRGGGLFAVSVASGAVAWSAPPGPCGKRRSCSPAQSSAVSAVPGVVFSGSMDGHLRAYSAADGAVLWDFDAVRPFETVNGIAAKGGSFDAGGVAVAGGMVFAESGYFLWGGMPGNVLLAFSVDGR
ncbi:MAG: PQQ-binding-like beta-propeller repeat protein [Elusimicrobia bacterium]|nr:PQQ-binding-like beta-propeller repeat protein [Elusimicrobiota bacterium]